MSSDRIVKAIPGIFIMISGSEDKQTSADVFNVGSFNLPDTAGKAGGACTSSLLKVLTEYQDQMTWLELLQRMREVLDSKGFEQNPQLSASRLIDADSRFEIVPQKSIQMRKARRAVLIGINYVGQKGQLSGCHNDVENIKRYLIKEQGFMEKDMLILMDDGKHHAPTRRNIIDAFTRITQYSEPGDIVFIHYSGHGGRVKDENYDEEDGYDETLIPVDFKASGHIVDDDVFNVLVKPMKRDVQVTVLMDCCHSGTALDLPYEMESTDSNMQVKSTFDMGLLKEPTTIACLACCALCMLDDLFATLL
eukprot:CAMPEP_0113638630 /NCGR_PEP_ID=MMETSP0017_2-20120614/20242_1 /TAXON_ID=2856 /ORGANISM="Cylindrotheca closterium" /LENGTH=306 /DNA_ID=CAMNT_0000549757 /DNA_START=84 /DNA_END=1004 /DNA_ORIENTATION=+ /assembly_acc=CAM_ASM_000147